MKKTKTKKLIPGIIISIIGIGLILSSFVLLKDKPNKKQETKQEQNNKYTYKNLTLESSSFDYNNGKMVFKATLHNTSKKDHEFEIALLVIKDKEGTILTEQSLVLPEVLAGNKEEITAEYADIVENIASFEIKETERKE